VKKVIRIILGFAVAIAAIAAFAAAAVIEAEPVVPPATLPVAEDVRGALLLGQTALAMSQIDQPADYTISSQWLEGAHRLVAHAKRTVRADGVLRDHAAAFRLSRRIATHGWLNLELRLVARPDGGAPRVELVAGPWRAPDVLPPLIFRLGMRLAHSDGPLVREVGEIIPHFAVTPDAIHMQARLPRAIAGAVQKLASSGGGPDVDSGEVRAVYGTLLAYQVLHPKADFPSYLRVGAREVDGERGLRSLVVAVTMLVDGPRIRRAIGERSETPPCIIPAQLVFIHGRNDSPKHWSLSAAIALLAGPRTARAVGYWKELDDSLPGGDGVPGGSGFSFVDLGTDLGGVMVGQVARSGDGADRLLALLRQVNADMLLPPAILRLPEGVYTHAFRHRYGGLEQPPLLRTEQRIRQMLAASPLYRDSAAAGAEG